MHHYNAAPYKTILFLHQHLYFPSKLAQIYNIQTRLATKVVCLLIPTSNHNSLPRPPRSVWVVYLLIPTSNHNQQEHAKQAEIVVYLLIPTSNHNLVSTPNSEKLGCISFDSYIKPQLRLLSLPYNIRCISFDSYIKPQLFSPAYGDTLCCISFDSYIKPQLAVREDSHSASCISFDSYIKPQPITIKCQRTNIL